MPSHLEIHLFSQSANYPMWVSAILNKLSEDCWTVPSSYIRSLAEIEASFSKQVKDAMDDKQAILADTNDPDYKWARINPNEHPWGDDIVKQCQRWLNEKSNPVAVYEFVDKLHKNAATELMDALPELTTGENGDRFAKIVSRLFAKAVEQLKL